MENKDGKPWERPWSTNEIKDNSENWNLAGDAGLLKHLQQFSQVLLERTHSSEVALNLLLDGMKATAVDISNVTNTFLMLTNTQFVENRVYDDDDDLKEKTPEVLYQVKTKEEQAAENLSSIKKALTLGISVLDTMFDTVDVPASDSEDEENSESMGRVVLQPRNTYLWQPLPCLIGSKDFIVDDTVGLAELLSDNEEILEQNMLPSSSSGTSSDVEHEITEADGSRHHRSVLSSESENSEPESERVVPLGKNNFFESARTFVEIPEEGTFEGAMFGGESPPEAESVKEFLKPTAAADFASELAAKLGGIPGEKTSIPGQDKSPGHDYFFGAGGDEDSLFGPPSVKERNEGGLFDDLDQLSKAGESLWSSRLSNQSISSATIASQETTSNTNSSHIQTETSVPEKKKKPVGGVSVLGMVNNTSSKISPYICGPPSTSSESDTNEEVEHQTAPGISSYSSETSIGIRNVTDHNERKTSFLDHLHSDAFASHSLFDPDEEDALFLPSSTPTKQQQSNVVNPSDYSDSVQKLGTVISKPSSSSRVLKHSSASKSFGPVLEGSDSDEDKNLFSSTCSSLSSRSSKSQMSNDLLAKSDKIIPKKDLFRNSSLFGGDYHDEPTFDVFDSTVPEISKNYNGKEINPIINVKGSESSGKPSSVLFESDRDDNVPDVFSNKSSIENPQSKEGIFSPKGFTGGKVDDLDDIFSAVKPIKKDNLDLFSTHKLDDDFDIFASVVATGTKHPSKNSTVKVPKSNETFSQNITEPDKKLIGENERHEIVTQGTGLMEATNLFSSALKPDLGIDLLLDKEDKTVGDFNVSGVKGESFSPAEVSSSISTTNKVNISTNFKKGETANVDQNKYVMKRDPPKSLSITKTTDLFFKAVPDDGIQEDVESALFTRDATAKSDSNSESSHSSARTDNISGSLIGSGTPSETKILQPVPESNVASEEKRFGIEKSHTTEGTSNLDASPLRRSPSSHTNINPQLLIPGLHFPSKSIPSETAISFDNPACISSVLPSNVKERVRIPAKRRPQSRKARKEALKSSVGFEEADAVGATSVIFEGIEKEFYSVLVLPQDQHVEPSPVLNFNSKSPKSEVTNSKVINADNHTMAGNTFPVHINDTLPFSPSTDEEDFFGVPSDLPYEYNNSKDNNGYKNEPLFGEAPVLSPVGERKDEDSNHITSDVKPHATQNVNSNTADNLPEYVVNSTSSQSNHKFLVKLSHENDELVKNGDKLINSCDAHSSEGDLFVPVDNTFLSENESESDIFRAKSTYKEARKIDVENVSETKNLNYPSDNFASNKTKKFDSLSTGSNQDKTQKTQQLFATNYPDLFPSGISNRPTVSKDELFQNVDSEVTDLFSSDIKQDPSSQLFDEQLFLPKSKNEQMFSSIESSSGLLDELNKIQLDSSSLYSVGGSSPIVKSSSPEDETHSSLDVEKTKSLAYKKVKSKKKDSIFFDHDDDEDVSMFSSSSQVAVSDTSRSAASPSKKTGSKSRGRIGENASRQKSLSQISKSGENFEDPLKVIK